MLLFFPVVPLHPLYICEDENVAHATTMHEWTGRSWLTKVGCTTHPGGLCHPRGGIPGGTLVVRTAEKMAPKERQTQKRSRKKERKEKVKKATTGMDARPELLYRRLSLKGLGELSV